MSTRNHWVSMGLRPAWAVCSASELASSARELTNSVAEWACSVAEKASPNGGNGFLVLEKASSSPEETRSAFQKASPQPELGSSASKQANSAAEQTGSVAGPAAHGWQQAWARPPPAARTSRLVSHVPRHVAGDTASTIHQERKDKKAIMAALPKREVDIVRLANDLAAGLAAHPEHFPSPPVSPEELNQSLAAYNAAREAAIVAAAQSAQGTAAKDEALERMVEHVKIDLRYAESATRNDDGRLQLLGWGAPRSRTPTGVPGQVRTLEVMREGKNWLFLDWKEPVEGGPVAAYKIQRRTREGGGDWTDVGMAVESEVTLNGQEPGVEFEYRVIAVNKAGEGPASNLVRAVL